MAVEVRVPCMNAGDEATSYANNSLLQARKAHRIKEIMDEVRVPCMNGGDEATSYANNSLLQKTVILKARPVLEETIKDMLMTTCFPASFKVADLGCSSGPNTLLVISEILDTIHAICQQFNQKSPEIQVFLNDLPENDFNSVFKSLPAFNQRLKKDKGDQFGPCFVSGVPCSFYERLFPSRSIHLIHSSYSVHCLSKVPENLGSNKKNIYIAKSSPPTVYKAYLEQFQRDFSSFLSLRSEEIIVGGRMILTFISRSIPDPSSKDCCYIWELLTKSFLELVDEGLVEAAKVDSFDIPCYYPCEEEVRDIVEKEGSFNLNKLEIFEVNWDPSDDPSNKEFVFNKYRSGKIFANCIRAVTEPLLLACHFGKSIIDTLFNRYANHVAQHLAVEKTKFVNIVVSMTKI